MHPYGSSPRRFACSLRVVSTSQLIERDEQRRKHDR